MKPDDFLQIAEGISDPLCLLTAQGEIMSANQAACKLFGRSSQDLQGKNLRDFIEQDKRNCFKQQLRNWSASRQPLPASMRICTADEQGVDCYCHGNLLQPATADSPALILLRSSKKKVLTTEFVTLNQKVSQLEKEIAQRRAYEKAYTESEEQVMLLLNSTGEALYGIDNKGDCTFVNAACLQLLGYDYAYELLGKNMHQQIQHSHTDGSPYPVGSCHINQAYLRGEHVQRNDEVFFRQNGSAFPVEYFAHPIKKVDEIIGMVVSFQDISERKAIESELERSQETLERAQAIAHVGSWDWDILTGELYWTDEIYRIFGLSPQQFGATYEAFLDFIHPDDQAAVTTAVTEAVGDENISYDIEHRIVRPDGSERIVNERGKVYRDAKGAPVRMIGTVQDITEQKKAKAYNTMLFENSPIGLALCDMQGNLVDINPAYANIVGRSIEETKKLTYWEITPQEYAEKEAEQLERLNKSGHYGPYEKEYIHKDGHRIGVRLLGQIVEFDGEPFIWSSVEDITETKQARDALQRVNLELEDRVEQRTSELKATNEHLQASLEQLKQTQEQLVQSEKMASLGGLVAGVAHEINTPVGVGVTAVTHLQMKVADYTQRYQSNKLTRNDFESFLKTANESSKMIHANLDRAAELIRSFKQVAVDQSSNELRSFNLREYLQEILQSLKPKLKLNGHLVSIDCAEDITLQNHPGALSQVVTNLVMNSIIHGFGEHHNGHISIAVREASQGIIQIDFRDDGKGIAPENLKKIFEPFFTTRRGQGGSGLGMHIVFNLVSQTLGGRIECHSDEGEGTHFHIELPNKTTSEEYEQQVRA